jgi:hypothetical protein
LLAISGLGSFGEACASINGESVGSRTDGADGVRGDSGDWRSVVSRDDWANWIAGCAERDRGECGSKRQQFYTQMHSYIVGHPYAELCILSWISLHKVFRATAQLVIFLFCLRLTEVQTTTSFGFASPQSWAHLNAGTCSCGDLAAPILVPNIKARFGVALISANLVTQKQSLVVF